MIGMPKGAVDINEVLESLENLDINDQMYISDVLSKRLIELKRAEIVRRAKEAEQAYRRGEVRKGTFKDLWDDLND